MRTFEQDFDVAYSQTPGLTESGQGSFGLTARQTNQWNGDISPMVQWGTDFMAPDNTRIQSL